MAELVPSGRVTAKIFPHPRNAWYAVAWDHEVTAKGLLARTVAGKPMAFYRTTEGRPVHPDAGAGDDQPQRDGAVLPRRRAAPVPVGVAG